MEIVDKCRKFKEVLTKEQLELLLQTQIEEENYELAGEITKKLKK